MASLPPIKIPYLSTASVAKEEQLGLNRHAEPKSTLPMGEKNVL